MSKNLCVMSKQEPEFYAVPIITFLDVYDMVVSFFEVMIGVILEIHYNGIMLQNFYHFIVELLL